MKKILLLMALGMGIIFVYAQGVVISTPEGDFSMGITGVMPEGDFGNQYIIDDIYNRLELLQKNYLSKLKKTDSRKANTLVQEIYELLEQLEYDGFAEVPEAEETDNSNVNSNSNSNTSSVNINIIGAQSQTMQTQPAPPPPPVIITPPDGPHNSRIIIDDSDFADLVSRIGKENFSDNKLRVLRTAAKSYRFYCGQIVRLIDAFTFSEEKLEALRISYPGCPDPHNNYKILDAFTYSTDKEEAEQIMN